MKGGSAGQITVFNPSSWRRREWIEAALPLPPRFANGLEIRHGGQPVPAVLASALRGSSGSLQEARVMLFADLPPLAVASYSVAAAAESRPPAAPLTVDSETLRIETPFWILNLDPQGGIASLRARSTGAPVLAHGRRSGFFAARVNGQPAESAGRWRFPKNGDSTLCPPVDRAPPRPGTAHSVPPWTECAVPGFLPFVEAREEGTLAGMPYRSDLRLWAHSPRLDYRVRFEFNGEKIGRLSDNRRDGVAPFVHEDKLRFKLYPAAAGALTGIRDLPFATAETPARYIDGYYWTALAGATGGLAFFNHGAMGAVREEDAAFSLPLAYSMYYIWGTRILDGEYTWEFALWPFAGAWRGADLHRRALEYNLPLTILAGDSGAGALGDLFAPIEFDSDGVLATALYPKGDYVHLRLFEHRGAPARARIKSSGRPWEEVDLAGRPLGPVAETLDFRPWQIRTIRAGR